MAWVNKVPIDRLYEANESSYIGSDMQSLLGYGSAALRVKALLINDDYMFAQTYNLI